MAQLEIAQKKRPRKCSIEGIRGSTVAFYSCVSLWIRMWGRGLRSRALVDGARHSSNLMWPEPNRQAKGRGAGQPHHHKAAKACNKTWGSSIFLFYQVAYNRGRSLSLEQLTTIAAGWIGSGT